MSPTWTVLVLTLGQREAKFRRLMDALLPQLRPYGQRARVLALWNNGEHSVPAMRQALVEAITTDYLCFVDDDDMVPEYYAQEVMRALEYTPDYVGWIVRYRPGHEHSRLCYHSMRHGGWFEKSGSLYRDISHINPIRTDIALRADFRRTRRFRAEDRVWVDQIRGLKAVRREVYIGRVMYHYLYSHTESDTWRHPQRVKRTGFTRPEIDHPNFEWYRKGAVTERAGTSQRRKAHPRAPGFYSQR